MKRFSIYADDEIDLATFFAGAALIEAPYLSSEYISAVANLLKRLSNNRGLLWDILGSSPLSAWKELYSAPQSILVGYDDRLAVRANVWLPTKAGKAFSQFEDELYAYAYAHNHDFSFLTVGYHGPGYETDLCDFMDERIEIQPGEGVSLTNRRRVRLETGEVWLYEQYCDVHAQHQPDDLSVSLNVLFQQERKHRDQLAFDLDSGRVLGPIGFARLGRLQTIIEMAQMFGDGQSRQHLETLSQTAPHQRIRCAAAKALDALRASAS